MARRSGPGLMALALAVVVELAGGLVAVNRHDGDAPERPRAATGAAAEPASATTAGTVPSSTAPAGGAPAPSGAPTLAPGLVPRRPSFGTGGTVAGPPLASGDPSTSAVTIGAPVRVGPPYVDATRASHCSDGLYERCTARSDPDPATGAVRLDVEVISPGGGTATGLGTAQAFSEVAAVHRLAQPARALALTVTIRLGSAEVRRTVAGVALPPLGGSSNAQVHLTASALHSVCGGSGCFANATQPLVDLAAGPQSRSGEEVTMRLRLHNPAGDLPAGDVAVSAGVYGWAELGRAASDTPLPDVGAVATKVDAVVSGITFAPAV